MSTVSKGTKMAAYTVGQLVLRLITTEWAVRNITEFENAAYSIEQAMAEKSISTIETIGCDYLLEGLSIVKTKLANGDYD